MIAMEITISKTIQVNQYEPLTVTVKEESKVDSMEEYEKLRKTVGACVSDILAVELDRYKAINNPHH